MAVKWPLANGNWSSAANWNGGTLPQAGDDVYADNRTITIDVATITVSSIRTDLRTGGTFGGRFNLGSGIPVFNITANIFTGTVDSIRTINIGVACTLNLIGNVFGASGGLSSRALSIESSNVVLNITGNMSPGTGQQTHTLYTSLGAVNDCTINLIGNINTAGTGIQVQVIGAPNSTVWNSCNINITGNVTHSYSSYINFPLPISLRFGTNNTFVLNGTVTQTSTGSPAIFLGLSNNNNTYYIDQCTSATSAGTAIDISPNTLSPNPGGVLTVRKIIHPSTFFSIPISIGDSRCSVIYRELLLPSMIKFKSDDYYVEAVDSLNTTLFLTEIDDINLRLPTTSNVRAGVTYNNGNRTGTLAVPIPSNVRKGVSTDNTVGTAELTAADILNAIQTSTIPVAERLRNIATVQLTGDQIASF